MDTDRKIRENVKGLLGETRLMSYLNIFRENLWPGGKLKPPGAPRTAEEKIRTRDDANRKLSSLVPGKICGHRHFLVNVLTSLKISPPI